MNQSKKYLLVLAATTTSICVAVAVFNAWIDPLWIFGHSHSWNQHQISINQRVQKSNYLYFGDHAYDSVLLGDSRSTTLRESDFSNMRLFNYSLNSTYPDEYEGLLAFYSSIQGPPKNILIGMAFFTTRSRIKSERDTAKSSAPETPSVLDAVQSLVSLDTLRYTLRTIRANADPLRERYLYDRSNTLTIRPLANDRREHAVQQQLREYRTIRYGSDYVYEDIGPKALLRIRKQYPNANVVVFTTPISAELFGVLVESGRFEDYARWLGDLVATGTTVIDMMGVNAFTTTTANYLDAHHFHTNQSSAIAEIVQIRSEGQTTVGQRVTQDNLSEHIRAQRQGATPIRLP